ncbi:DUF6515 family protein [Microbulbifer marinus]|uniref:Uncharacterized protein n=1 Tax=Microbulbifer marinus TaxID=658218 RepID=A0A1H4B1M0_9GAMM|nr:DUF6515 family protein [Microbulbifer marinus]SEA42030.1 hypothetical protein SAMN05216562_3040 [Microbulbifer marinus]
MHYAIALLLSLAVSLAWAQDRLRSLPSGASQILAGGQTYHYWRGSFYRPSQGGYVRVEPPLGARVPNVPGSSATFKMGGERYFVSRGTFFLYDPRGDDFAVITPPSGWREYYREPPQLRSLAAPTPRPPAVTPRTYPAPEPRYRPETYYGRYRGDYYYRGNGYYGRYGYRDNIADLSYRELRSTCRSIARDQSRRGDVGPYRRQPGSYWDEYKRCMR